MTFAHTRLLCGAHGHRTMPYTLGSGYMLLSSIAAKACWRQLLQKVSLPGVADPEVQSLDNVIAWSKIQTWPATPASAPGPCHELDSVPSGVRVDGDELEK